MIPPRAFRSTIPLIVLGVAWALAGALRLALPSTGLRAQYFLTSDWTGAPVRVEIEPGVSTGQISKGWRYNVPNAFSIQWSGTLLVSRSGDYTFSVTSAGGSQLFVDGERLVDTSRLPGVSSGAGRLHLERGAHAVVFRYLSSDGVYRVEWSWGLGTAPLEPVPFWRLSPRPLGASVLVFRLWLAWIWTSLTIVVAVVIASVVWARGYWPRRPADDPSAPADGVPRTALGPSLLCLALFAVLAIVHTWPLARVPGRLSRNDNADAQLNEWAMAWVVHQAPRHPFALFDGNVLYPEKNVLALSEPLLLESAMAAPVLWLGGSPVLASNLVLMAGFALTGWAMCLVVATWTKRWAAGVAAGAIFAFNAHTLTRLPHVQAQHAEFLPLALLALDALLVRPRWRTAAWLALWTALEAFACMYLFVFTSIALAIGVIVRPEDWLGDRFRRVAPKLLGAALLAAVLLLPLLGPYWRLHEAGYGRSLDDAGFFAASARDYLSSESRLYPQSSEATAALFPGFTGLALAGVTILTGAAFRDRRARMCLAFGVCGVVLSFGPAYAPGYARLYSVFPLLQAIRVSARFGYLGIVAVAVLAGHGLAAIGASLGSRGKTASAVLAAAAAIAAIEPLAAPISYTPFDRILPIYRLPASDPGALVADLPFPPPDATYRNAPYKLASTLNWKPLLNGYEGFTPASYVAHYEALRDFPSAASIAALQSLGVTHVFVHLDQLDSGAAAAIDRDGRLRRLGADGAVVAYRVATASPRSGTGSTAEMRRH